MKKECPFRDTDPVGAKCPAYATQLSCWDFDWIAYYRRMPDGPEKTEWKRTMLEWCSSCEIRSSHAAQVDALLEKLRGA